MKSILDQDLVLKGKKVILRVDLNVPMKDGTVTESSRIIKILPTIKLLVEKKLDEGQNEKQIYDYLKNKYGEWILYDPKFDKNTYFLWLLPILLFIIGGAIIIRLFIIKKK